MLQMKIVAKSPHIGTRLKGSGMTKGELEAVAPLLSRWCSRFP